MTGDETQLQPQRPTSSGREPPIPDRTAATDGGPRGSEAEQALVQELSTAIVQAETVEGALEIALRELCAVSGWAFAQAWLCGDGPYLECNEAWCAESPDLQPFRTRSESMTFALGAGLPGKALESGHPEWSDDLKAEPETPRAPFAKEAGLGAGLAVPVLAERDIVAVLEFFMSYACERDEQAIGLVSAVAAQLGALIQRKRAEKALRESEERFRLLIDSVEDCAIFMLDTNGQVASWNAGAQRITGFTSEDMIGCHVSRLYAPDSLEGGKPDQHLSLAAQRGRFEEADWRVREDGLRFWASVVITAVREDGELRGFSHVIRDATSQKRASDELQRLRSIVEFCDDAIVSLTPERGIVTTWNHGAERLFGYTSGEVIGRSISLLASTDRSDQTKSILEQALRQNHVAHHEIEVVRKNKSLVEIAATVSPIRDPGGQLIAVSLVARDITDRKCTERHIERALGTYLDPDVAEHILNEGASLSGVEHDVTMMFLDIRNFTSVAERSQPHEIVDMLNRLFGVSVPVIARHRGHVDKFVGDGLLAVFGVPDTDPGHADRALQAALGIAEEAHDAVGGAVEFGIGIHSGNVIAASVGGGGRLDFTVIGDAVNTAARIEAATRQTGDTILFSDQTKTRLRTSDFPFVERPAVRIKGKRDPLPLWAPILGSAGANGHSLRPAPALGY